MNDIPIKKYIKMIWTFVYIPVGFYLALCILLFLFQRYLIYFPDKNILYNPKQIGLVYEDIHVQTSDNAAIHGWFVPAESSKGVLLFCHGNAGNISHRLESILIFNKLSLDVLIFDYRGFGKSSGSPNEEGTYADAEAIWHYLISEKKYAASEIIVFGRSLGSGIASWLARQHTPSALILESSYTSLPDLGAKIYPFFPVRLLSRYHYPTSEHLSHIKCPILFIHSKNDEIIPYSLGLKNYELASEPKQFLEIKGSHNDGFLVSGEHYVDSIYEFLAQNTGRGPDKK